MRTFVAAPAAEGTYPGDRLLHRHLPAHRAVAALGGAARRLRLPGRRARDLPPRRAAGHRARFDDEGKARGQADAEAITTAEFDEDIDAALDVARRARGEPVGAAGTAPAATSRSAPRSTRACDGTALWYPTGLHNGKLGKDESDRSRARARSSGELLLIFGTRDPHTPPPGRDTVKAGAGRGRHALQWQRVRRRARLRARHRPALRPRGHRPRVRARPSRSSAGCCGDPLRPPGVGELPEGADPARAARARVRACHVDLFTGETRRPEHLARNPDGRVPVLELDSGELIPESGAILLYLAEGTPFLPPPGVERARVHQWLFFEQNQLEAGARGGAVHEADGARRPRARGVREPARPGAPRTRRARARAWRTAARSSPATPTPSPTSRSTPTCTPRPRSISELAARGRRLARARRGDARLRERPAPIPMRESSWAARSRGRPHWRRALRSRRGRAASACRSPSGRR